MFVNTQGDAVYDLFGKTLCLLDAGVVFPAGGLYKILLAKDDPYCAANALTIMENNENKTDDFDDIQICLRDLYILQITHNATSRDDLLNSFAMHFGDYYTNQFKSKLLNSYHHLFRGKYTKNARPRPRRRKLINIALLNMAGEQRDFVCDKTATLGEVQKDICELFGHNSPTMIAELMVNGRRPYNKFTQKPFLRCKDKMMVNVVFYDREDDRYAPKMILEEELLSRPMRSAVVP